MDLVIRNATIAGVARLKDIGIESGSIVKISDRIEPRGHEEINAEGNLVAPGFIDVHMHLDKALTLDRYDWATREIMATPRLTSVNESNKVKRTFTVEDVCERATRIAEMCIVNGTTTLRSHVDIDPVVGLIGMRGVLAAKEACKDWIDIQISPYAISGFDDAPEDAEKLLRQALDMGADLMGGVPEADKDGNSHVDRVFAIAKEYNFDIDFHTDQAQFETPFALPYIAEKTIVEGWQGRVMASHCFGLAHHKPEIRQKAVDLCREADVSICCTPFTTVNERVIEPVEAGVNVSYMSDNIRDTWQPYGNADMLQLALFVARLGRWRSNEDLDHLLEMGSTGAAKAIGIKGGHGLVVGNNADLVVFEAKSGHEAIITQAQKLWVVKRGRVVAQQGELLV
ncbi:MAG: hypothetical protein BZY82_10180 [SAR202 cluster bacterium Io17-Chloro-G3]|nr:MAG: hypothetical protein BZY82_10180 [SAR202 cluster bacterium Io17-Chloro-G3]